MRVASVFVIGSLIFVWGIGAAAVETVAQEDREPPQQFRLQVDGRDYRIETGGRVEIEVGGQRVNVVLHAEPNRIFGYADLRFPYPAEYAFSSDISDDMAIWTLNSERCLVMIQRFSHAEIEADDFAQALVDQYGEANAERRAAQITLGGRRIEGARVAVRLGPRQGFIQEIYALPTEGGSRILVIQDNLDEAMQPTQEVQRLRELWQRNFEF